VAKIMNALCYHLGVVDGSVIERCPSAKKC
jgi:hypothetical protein